MFQLAELSNGPSDLDLSNDGELLACAAMAPDGKAHLAILETATGEFCYEREYPGHHARGTVLLDDKEFVYLVTHGGHHALLRGNRTEDEPQQIARYPQSSRVCNGIVRDREARYFAVLGGQAEIWDTARSEVVRTLPGANHGFDVCAAFSADGNRLYAYGTIESSVVCYDVASGEETRRWPAPRPFGGQVVISPDERYLVATGVNHNGGVFVYDMVGDRRLLTDDPFGITQFDEELVGGPWVFRHDNAVLAELRGWLGTYRLPDLEEFGDTETDELMLGWTATSAWDAPVAAFGIYQENKVAWLTLPNA